MKNKQEWLYKLGPIVILLLITIIFFWKFFFLGYLPIGSDILAYRYYPWKYYHQGVPKNPLLSDPVTIFYPYKDYFLELIRKNKISLWNPYICCGMPCYNISTFFRIPNLLGHFLSTPMVYALTIILPLFLAGLFMYLFLRYSIKLGRFSALLGSVVFMLNGVFMVWLEFESVVQSVFLFPLGLLFIDKTITKKSAFFSILTAIILANILFISHLYFIYSLLILILFCLFRLWLLYYKGKEMKELFKVILLISTVFLLGLLLPSGYLFPTFEQFEYSHREPLKFEELNPLPMENLITLIIPDFYGSPAEKHNYRIIREWFYRIGFIKRQPIKVGGENYNEYCCYIGIFPLILALIGGCLRRDAWSRFFFCGCILSLLLALGTPLYLLLYHFVPGLSRVGISRFLVVFTFFGSILAGLGSDFIVNNQGKIRDNLVIKAISWLLIIGSLGWILLLSWFSWKFYKFSNPLTEHFNIINPSMYLPILFIFFSIIVLKLWRSGRIKPIKFKIAIFVIVVIDLMIFGMKYNPMSPLEFLFPDTDSTKFLQRKAKLEEPFRIVAFGQTMPPNTNLVYRLQSVEGYEASYPKRYFNFMKNLVYPGVFHNWIDVDVRCNRKILNLLNVKYILSERELNGEDLELVYDGEIKIYEDLRTLPRAWVVSEAKVLKTKDEIFEEMRSPEFNPKKIVIFEEDIRSQKLKTKGQKAKVKSITNYQLPVTRIIDYQPEKVVIDVKMPYNGFLVLSDSWYPGWKVFINGVEDKIFRANYILRAVYLREGNHRVEFIFSPLSFKIGLIVSFITFFGILLIGIFFLLKHIILREPTS